MRTILSELVEHARATPDALAIVTRDTRTTYGELVAALRLRASQMRPRDGVVRLVRQSQPVQALSEALAWRMGGGVPLVVDPSAPAPAPGEPAEPEVALELYPGTAWLKRTGGSTGVPKLVAIDEAQALALTEAHTYWGGVRAGRTAIATVPPWTTFGWNAWAAALTNGATLRYVAPTAPRELLDALAEPGVVSGCTTPPVIRALARLAPGATRGSEARPDGERPYLVSSSATFPLAEALEVYARHGITTYDRYGSTEAGSVGQARTIGGRLHPTPGVTLTLEGEGGGDGSAAAGGGGPATLTIRSRYIALGLVGGPAFGGVFRTADAAEIAADGTFVVRGRVDRIVKRAGRIVDLPALEALVARMPGVAFARVRVAPSALDVDLVLQVVASETGPELDVAALRAGLAARLEAHERPSEIVVVAREAAGELAKWTARGEA